MFIQITTPLHFQRPYSSAFKFVFCYMAVLNCSYTIHHWLIFNDPITSRHKDSALGTYIYPFPPLVFYSNPYTTLLTRAYTTLVHLPNTAKGVLIFILLSEGCDLPPPPLNFKNFPRFFFKKGGC